MLFQLLSSMAKKKWDKATSPRPPHTITPIKDLTQGSAIEINPVPLILSQGNGSSIKTIDRSMVIAVSEITQHSGRLFRCYLSQEEGAFLQFATSNSSLDILECRLFQPYDEIVPMWDNVEPGEDQDLSWSFWLADDPDPDVGGLIGCPIMPSKNDDLGEDGQPKFFQRSWLPSNKRILPFELNEHLISQSGDVTELKHLMMNYRRPLKGNQTEYLLVSCVESNDEASVNFWLGIDIQVSDLTVYAPATT